MALKYAIREPRPATRDNYYVQYGMPSSHSQFMLFFATYTILFVLKRWAIFLYSWLLVYLDIFRAIFTAENTFSKFWFLFRLHHNSPVEKVLRAIAMSILGFVTVFVCIGRVYLLYHTISQVIVGAIIGTSFGLLWFLLVHVILTPYIFPRIVSWKISELLLIRDTSLIPNVMLFEYTRSRQESLARSRKNMKQQ